MPTTMLKAPIGIYYCADCFEELDEDGVEEYGVGGDEIIRACVLSCPNCEYRVYIQLDEADVELDDAYLTTGCETLNKEAGLAGNPPKEEEGE